MRALLSAVAVIAVVVILLGIFLKALKWLIIIGAIALVASVVMGLLQGRRTTR
jgi:hypothetical protein